MRKWRIELAGERPVTVEVDPDRNLAQEFLEFQAACQRPWWRFWGKPSPYWQICDDVVVHRDAVAGILERPEKTLKKNIGFLPPSFAYAADPQDPHRAD